MNMHFDPTKGEIVDPQVGDLYVRTPNGTLEYAVVGKVMGGGTVTLLTGGDGRPQTVLPGDARGWQRGSQDGALVALISRLTDNLVDREGYRIENLNRAREAEAALEDLKNKVREVAFSYGKKFDMCEKLADALEELGIDATREIRVSGTFETTVTVRWGDDVDEAVAAAAMEGELYLSIEETEDV